MRVSCGCSICVEKGVVAMRSKPWIAHRRRIGNKRWVDLVKKKDYLSANNGLEFMDGGSTGPHVCTSNNRLQCMELERGEQRRDKRRVLDLYGYSHLFSYSFGKWFYL